MEAKADIWQVKHEQAKADADRVKGELTPNKAMELAKEKGSSSWLTVLPIEEHGFCLHKGAFVDALALRYGWAPAWTPTNCVCRAGFTLEHALSSPREDFPPIHHNEIRNLTATLPDVQEITDEVMTRQTRITTKVLDWILQWMGFGEEYSKNLLDVRVFNPCAPSNRQCSIEMSLWTDS